MNSNMINPANYYNPFAKYNYVSKTRGAYVPQSPSAVNGSENSSVKSANIWEQNYDPETEVISCLSKEESSSNGIWNMISEFFNPNN